jgi:hypothetical protein
MKKTCVLLEKDGETKNKILYGVDFLRFLFHSGDELFLRQADGDWKILEVIYPVEE